MNDDSYEVVVGPGGIRVLTREGEERSEARSLTALPEDVRRKFIEAERRRDRFWLWTAIVSVVLCGAAIIAWAISKI
jgi:hypothetical protein